jgi:hypothetical protein
MNNSIQLRKDMEDLMKNLHKDLEEWNQKLFNNNIIDMRSRNQTVNRFNSENNIKENININNNNIDNNNNIYNSMDNNNIDNNNIDNLKIEANLINIDENNNIKRHLSNLDKIFNSVNYTSCADEETVKEVVKNWIMGQTFLVKIHLYLNKHAFCYRMILGEKEEDKFVINTIQGKNEYIPLIERKIDEEISKLNLTSFRKNEIKVLKKFLKQLNKIDSYDFIKIIFFLNNENENKEEYKKRIKESLQMQLRQDKFKQFSKIKNSKLFKKYLRISFLLQQIIIDIKTIISNNFHWVCYSIMILNHIINASILSLFYPISIFCFALLENPRPSKKYWNICIYYTFFFSIIKYLTQNIGNFFKYIDENNPNNFYQSLKLFLVKYPIGIEIYDNSNEYLMHLIIDFMVLAVLFINVHILIVNGLWDYTEKYLENIYEAMQRKCTYEEEKKFCIEDYIKDKLAHNRYTKERTTMLREDKTLYQNYLKNLKDKYIEETKNYFQKLFPKIRNEKPGKDFYFVYSFSMILIIFYVLIFYTTMVQDKAYSITISTNQFSGMSVILVLLHMMILIYDRVIYLRQNRYNLKYEYNFYNKKTKKFAVENESEYDEIKENIIKKYPSSHHYDNFIIPLEYLSELKKQNYSTIIFQIEPFNIPLLEKYILYIFLTISSHIFIFFFITMMGNYNLNNALFCEDEVENDCNGFLNNKSTVFFYFIYLIYLIFSGLQIKYGFYDVKRKSIFKNVKSIQGLLFEAYKSIPFYYPIKNVVDWTFTQTSLNLFDWFKFENIYDAIFKTYRIRYPIEKKPIGKRVKKIYKLSIGGITSFILISFLVLPLILFSSLNPTNEQNNIKSAEMKVYLSFVNENKQEKNYLIFENSWAESIESMNNNKEVWETSKYDDSFYTQTFPKDQIQIVSFYTEPENSLSEFKLSHINSSLVSLLYNDTEQKDQEEVQKCNLIIETNFIRPLPNEAKTVKHKTELLICSKSNLDSKGCKELNKAYDYIFKNTTNIASINISGFSPTVRLTASSEPKNIDLKDRTNRNIYITPLKKQSVILFEIYYDNINNDNNNNKGIQYHVFNDKVSTNTFGYSVIGFYSAFVLVIGTYVANFFNYTPEKIIIGEMPHPEKLLNLCECVKISRYTYDFKKEEYLYNILVEILRTPDFIKKLTQSTIEQFQRRSTLAS